MLAGNTGDETLLLLKNSTVHVLRTSPLYSELKLPGKSFDLFSCTQTSWVHCLETALFTNSTSFTDGKIQTTIQPLDHETWLLELTAVQQSPATDLPPSLPLSVFAEAKEAIVMATEHGVIHFANQAFLDIFHTTHDKTIGQNVTMLMSDNEKQEHATYMNEYVEGQRELIFRHGRRVIAKRRGNESFPLYIAISELFHQGKRWFIAFMHDLSAMEAMELQLSDAKAIFDQTLNLSPSPLMVLDNNRQLKYCNQEFERFFREQDSPVWQSVFDRESKQSFLDLLEKVRISRQAQKNTLRLQPFAASSDAWYKVHITPIIQHDQLLSYIVSFTDITREQQRTQKLQNEVDKAQLSIQAKSRFLAKISHEIRTPLNAIRGFSQVLSHDASQHHLPARFTEIIQDLDASAVWLEQLTTNLLELSQMEAKKFSPVLSEVLLPDLIGKALVVARGVAKPRNIRIVHEGDNRPLILKTDAIRLIQVLNNVLCNGIKFSPDHSTVTLTTRVKDMTVLFSIRDSGPGIAPDKIDHIFKPFEQENDNIFAQFGGTGLGLTISRQIMDSLHGDIRVLNREQGAEFIISLPQQIIIESSSSLIDTTSSNNSFSQQMEGCRVLIAEDNALNRKVAKNLFQRLGASVMTFENGQELLWYMNQQPELPDLVILDLNMPVCDGMATTRKLRQHWDKNILPVFILSADTTNLSRQQGLSAGVNAFLPKPVCVDTLVEAWNMQLNYRLSQQINEQKTDQQPGHIQTGAQLPEVSYSTVHETFTTERSGYQQDGSQEPELSIEDTGDRHDKSLNLDRQQMLNQFVLTLEQFQEPLRTELRSDFLKQCESVIPEIEQACSERHFEEIRQRAHFLKGSCLNMGLENARQHCTAIETYAKRSDSASCQLSLTLLKSDLLWLEQQFTDDDGTVN